MKLYLKKIAFLCLAVSCAFSAVGCSGRITPKKLLKQASENLENVTSSANQVELAIQLEDVLELREVNMEMEMENTTDPRAGHAAGTAKVNIRDAEVAADIEIYQVMEEGKYVTYSSMDGQWEREQTEDSAENHIGVDGNVFAQEGKAMEKFRLSDEEVTVEGKTCYQMYGDVSGEDLMGILGKSMVNAFGLVELPDEQAIRKLQIPVIFDIYKEEMLPARMIVDMSGVLNELYASYDQTTEVNLYSIELVFTDYNQIDGIEVPQEVKDAADSAE